MTWLDTWPKRVAVVLTAVGALWGAFVAVQRVVEAPDTVAGVLRHVTVHHHGDSLSATPEQVEHVLTDVHVLRARIEALVDTAEVEQMRRRERNQRRDFLLCEALGIPPSQCNP